MKLEPTIVPKKKCPLDVLAGLGEETKGSWIFLHKSVVQRLMDTADEIHWFRDDEFALCKFSESASIPITEITFECSGINSDNRVWAQVSRISAYDIAFDLSPQDPKNIFFLKMEE